MAFYKKKPVIIEAIQWDGTQESSHKILRFCKMAEWKVVANTIIISTLEGDMNVFIDDYVIKRVQGEFYPCKPDIFEKTYEFVSE